MTKRFQPTFWATIIMVVALGVLMKLALWQVERQALKTSLLEHIEAGMSAPAQVFPERAVVNPKDWDYKSVTLGGVYLFGQELYLRPRVYQKKPGVHVITPLKRDDGSILLINRGFAPEDQLGKLDQPEGFVSIEAVSRIPRKERGRFTPENHPENDMWYWLDVAVIEMHFDLEGLVPLVFYQSRTKGGEIYPIGDQLILKIPNNHRYYAFFWFAMGGIMVVIYFLFHYRDLPRKSKAKKQPKKEQ